MTAEPSLRDMFNDICSRDLPLRERLQAFSTALATTPEGQPFARAYQELIDQLARAGAGSGAPDAGAVMPDFVLPQSNNELVSFQSLLGAGPIVVSFNRGHWCEFCELELRAFDQAHEAFSKRGARVISIMPERLQHLRQAEEKTPGTVTYLSDIDNAYSLQLGLTVWLGDVVKKLFVQDNVDLAEYQGNSMWFVPIPATFVLNADGTIITRKVNPDFRTRMDIEEILSSLPQAAP